MPDSAPCADVAVGHDDVFQEVGKACSRSGDVLSPRDVRLPRDASVGRPDTVHLPLLLRKVKTATRRASFCSRQDVPQRPRDENAATLEILGVVLRHSVRIKNKDHLRRNVSVSWRCTSQMLGVGCRTMAGEASRVLDRQIHTCRKPNFCVNVPENPK